MIQRCLKKAKVSLFLTILAIAISSFSLCLIPFTSGIEKGQNNIIAYGIAAVFWIGIILSLIATHYTKKRLHSCCEKVIIKKYMKNQILPGLLNFSLNWMSIVLYSIIAVGLILIITDIIFGYVPEMVMFPIISVTILSFALHCVLDGKYYKVYKLIKESVNNETNR